MKSLILMFCCAVCLSGCFCGRREKIVPVPVVPIEQPTKQTTVIIPSASVSVVQPPGDAQ